MGRSRGRKRKDGKRLENGRLSRAGKEPLVAQPSAWVKAQRDRFGVHYCWAMGRAFAVGLLGDAGEGLNRYQAAKKFLRLHQRFYGGVGYTCPLDDSPRGSNVVSLDVPDHQEAEHDWIRAAIDAMDVAGVRPYFDQLISRESVDRGPAWLDRMVAVIDWNEGLGAMNAELRKQGQPTFLPRAQHSGDIMVLSAAIRALDIIAPAMKPQGIVSQRWA